VRLPRLRDTISDPRAVAVMIFAYGCARAARLAITHDEAMTYLFHVRASWAAVFAHTAPLPSNNHLLNTLLVKALQVWLPPYELVLRLPALLGLALYLWAAQRLLRADTTGIRRPLGMLLLAGNPFLLDLLVVCRGYALALGLSLTALALLQEAAAGPTSRGRAARVGVAALAAAAAVAANLAFAYAFVSLALVAAWNAASATSARRDRARGAVRATLVAAAPFALAGAALRAVYTPAVIARIQRVVSTWGGERGVWRDTVPSLADGTLYGVRWLASGYAVWVVGLTVFAAVVLAAGTAVSVLSRPHGDVPAGPVGALSACVVALLGWMVQVTLAHALGGLRYPLERAAAMLIPWLTLAFVLLWEAAARRPRARPAVLFCAAAACVGLLHFTTCVNLDHTYLWRADADMRVAMRSIAGAAAGAPPGAMRLGVSWELEPAANFYRLTRGIAGLAPVTRADLSTGFDLYLLTHQDTALVSSLELRPCEAFTVSGTVLAAAPGIPCPRTR
jgi:hypothetical protein